MDGPSDSSSSDPGVPSTHGVAGGREASGPDLALAVSRLLDRLVESSARTEVGTDEPAVWGPDAASSPQDYWAWQHAWRADAEVRSAAGEVDPLPTDGPLLSVVVPVFRPSRWFLEDCVRSIVRQTYRNWELCLCDDGSGDPDLTATLRELSAADPRVTAVALPVNGGISAATNRAVSEGTGTFVVMVDHDDVLEPTALAELASAIASDEGVDVVYTDEDHLDGIERPCRPLCKPDWDPDLLLTYPYLGHLLAVRRELLERIGGFRTEFDGSQDFDVMLRSTELARRVVHIPKILYHWRMVPGSAAGSPDAKPWAHDASRRALADTLTRRGIDGVVVPGPFAGAYHVRRTVHGSPSVSVIIPFRDQPSLTAACLASLERGDSRWISEVVLVDNGSTEPETTHLRRTWEARPATRVLDYPGSFNWSAINNLAASHCTGDMLLFLNNDIEATSDGWLEAMVELGQRPEVGAVGARLLYPDGAVQHAGVVLGMQGIATHIFQGMPPGRHGYMAWDQVVRAYSAVTAACLLVRREVFEEAGGFDEQLPVAFNDIDFCLRLGRLGYRTLYTPHAELIHHESVSRGLSGYTADFQRFLSLWWGLLQEDDPAYNRNLGRFAPWCPLRQPGEDERWREQVGALVPPGTDPRAGAPEARDEPIRVAGGTR